MNTDLRAARQEDLLGQVLLGRYRIVRELAKGGMGVLYLARAEGAVGFVKPVVVKLVLPEHAQDARYVGMFVREAQILAQLRHPSIVDVLEFGEQDGAYVLVLEYVRGYHLGQWSRYLQLKKRTAPADMLILIVIDVLDALHHAHSQCHADGTSMHIVHRDVSPGNVLLDEDGRARLLDFGVARMRGGAYEYKTQVDSFVGKLPYTAPEVFASVEASPQSDLYAAAVVLHEALLGRNVFRAETQAATMNRVINHTPEAIEGARADAPTGLDAALARALAKSPDQRYADARELASVLRKLLPQPESEIRARLAAVLKQDFGDDMATLLRLESLADRDEAWRKLSQRPERPRLVSDGGERRRSSAEVPAAPSPDGVTAVESNRRIGRQSRSAIAAAPEIAPQRATEAAAAEHAAEPVTVTTPAMRPPAATPEQPIAVAVPPRARDRSSKALVLGLIVVGALAIAAIVLSLRTQPAPAPAAPVPAIRVVTQRNDPLPAPNAATAAPSAAIGATGTASTTTPAQPPQAPAQAPAAATRTTARNGKAAPDLAALTRAFRGKSAQLEACYRAAAKSPGGATSAQLELDLDARGKILHAAVAPATLANTPLGVCMLKVARATKFPGQGQKVSFDIPVTVSRARGG